MFKKLNFVKKLFLSHMLLSCAVILTISVVNRIITYNALYEETRVYSTRFLDDYTKTVDNKTSVLMNELYDVLNEQGLNQEDEYETLLGKFKTDIKTKREMSRISDSFFNVNPYIFGVTFLSTSNKLYINTATTDIPMDLVKEKLNAAESTYNELVSLDDKYFLIIKPMFDRISMRKIGYSGFVIDQDFYMDTIQYSMKANGWKVVLYDQTGGIIFSTGEQTDIQFKYIKNLGQKTPYTSYQYTYEGKKYVYTIGNAPKEQIKIMTIIPPDALSESAYEFTKAIAITAIIVFIIAVLVSRLMSFGLSSSTKYVAKALQEISKGNFKQRIYLNTKDEIATIADEINHMAESIDNLIQEAYVAEIQKEQAQRQAVESEYAALCAKMNPHFIYNVLEGINSLAKIHHNEEISDTICLFADLLHDILDDNREMVYLEDEIDYMNKFIRLKSILRRGMFEFQTDIDEELLGAKVPHFILQPIVENAFKHGIDKNIGLGIIKVSCYKKGEELYLVVKDNGTRKQYSKNMEIDTPETTWKNTSIGMKSINKRLKFLYGENYGVTIEYGNLTTVTILLPYRTR